MGYYKFKLSAMIPNAWFYKLKDRSRARNQNVTHPTMEKNQHFQTPSSSASAAVLPPSKLEQQPHLSHQRKSYHFTRDQTAPPPPPNQDKLLFYDNLAENLIALGTTLYPEPPKKSSEKRPSTRQNRLSGKQSHKPATSSVSAGCSCKATIESVWIKPDSTPEDYPNSPLDSSSELESILPQYGSDRSLVPETFDGMLSWSASCSCRVDRDFTIGKEFNAKIDERDKAGSFGTTISGSDLPKIITKTRNFCDTEKGMTNRELNEQKTEIRRSSAKFEERNAYGSLTLKLVKEEQKAINGGRRSSSHSSGMKLRTNSPRIQSRRIQSRKSVSSSSSSSSRRSLSESHAVIKSSKDPQKDFKDSMVEMIVENNIFGSKDLEDLLACYLSLNSDEYHGLIIKVFKQIWFDIIDPCLK